MNWIIFAGVIVLMALLIWTSSVNYRLGVNDGYMFAKDPTCPGYRKARRILETYGKISSLEGSPEAAREQAKAKLPDVPAPR